MRASQINGCAYCLDVHSKDARALGETEQRLYVLDAWEEAPFYSERERAALALTEAVTRITEGHVPDAVFERARAHFNEQELIALVFTLTTINAWNRLAITMRTEVGNYQPKGHRSSHPHLPSASALRYSSSVIHPKSDFSSSFTELSEPGL